jgi:hypothetical protein
VERLFVEDVSTHLVRLETMRTEINSDAEKIGYADTEINSDADKIEHIMKQVDSIDTGAIYWVLVITGLLGIYPSG